MSKRKYNTWVVWVRYRKLHYHIHGTPEIIVWYKWGKWVQAAAFTAHSEYSQFENNSPRDGARKWVQANFGGDLGEQSKILPQGIQPKGAGK